MKEKGKNQMFQHSTMAALVGGLFSGTTTLKNLMSHGNLGIGTLDALDGELIIVDGEAYQICEKGKARLANPEFTTPYAVITNFEPDVIFTVTTLKDRSQIEEKIASIVPGANIFYALKITGQFRSIHARVAPQQNRPFPPLKEAVKKQTTYLFEDIGGTMVGFFTPDYISGIGVNGYHIHFIDERRKIGGHVFDYELLEGTIEIANQLNFELELPQTSEFLQSDLAATDLLEQIEAAENK